MQSFVDSYYATDNVVASDAELAAWFVEASGPAQAYDFPCAPVDGKPTACDRATLVDLLTHMAYLTGVQYVSLPLPCYHPPGLTKTDTTPSTQATQ